MEDVPLRKSVHFYLRVPAAQVAFSGNNLVVVRT